MCGSMPKIREKGEARVALETEVLYEMCRASKYCSQSRKGGWITA